MFVCLLGIVDQRNKIFLRSKSLSKKSNLLLKNKFNQLDYCVYGAGYNTSKLNYILHLTFIYDLLERTSDTIAVLKKHDCKSILKLKKIKKKFFFIKDLNKAYKKEVFFIKKILEILKIKALLLHTDQTLFSTLIIDAAKELKIDTAVIAHGIFSNEKLVGVLPLKANKIFTWTNQLSYKINKITKSTKAIYIPGIKFNLLDKSTKRTNIVYAGSPFYLIKKEKLEIIFFKTLNVIKKNHPKEKIIFCAHPMEDSEDFKFKIEEIGLIFSKNRTYSELEKARVVYGDFSSILYESVNNYINSFQIKELVRNKVHFIENVTRVSYKKIKNLDFKKKYFNKKNLKFDSTKIINSLNIEGKNS